MEDRYSHFATSSACVYSTDPASCRAQHRAKNLCKGVLRSYKEIRQTNPIAISEQDLAKVR
eukprot:1307636-Pleurochrysis_carterae.AAC.2